MRARSSVPPRQRSCEHEQVSNSRASGSDRSWQQPPEALCHCCHAAACKAEMSEVSFHGSLLPTLTSHVLALPASAPRFDLELILGHFQNRS